MWLTRQGQETSRIVLLKITIRELITYLIFLTICSIGKLVAHLRK